MHVSYAFFVPNLGISKLRLFGVTNLFKDMQFQVLGLILIYVFGEIFSLYKNRPILTAVSSIYFRNYNPVSLLKTLRIIIQMRLSFFQLWVRSDGTSIQIHIGLIQHLCFSKTMRGQTRHSKFLLFSCQNGLVVLWLV